MKRIAFSITLILLLTTVLPAHAATDMEMEKARVATIKTCLRNMRNGADYLDNIKPSSLEDLKSKLTNDDDKKHFQYLAGLSVAPGSQYHGWDDAKLHEYWSKTFVKQIKSNITSDFKQGFCSTKVAEAVSGIKSTVTAEAQEEADPEAQDTTGKGNPKVSEPSIVAEPAEEAVPGGAQLEPQDEMVKPQPTPIKKDNSNTGAIVVLCILVLVVIALVGYALNVMKKNKARQTKAPRPSRRREDDRDYDNYGYGGVATVQSDPEEESPFAAYSGGYVEQPAPREAPRDREIERLRAEIASLQSQVGAAQQHTMPRPAAHRSQPRVIYLAQANAEGVFTRADARFNMGNSIFKLVTTDGISGSFSVIEDPAVYELALMMPTDFLVNACSGQNLQLSEGARSIINEASGTAIFEDGRWRVSRKARIRYLR